MIVSSPKWPVAVDVSLTDPVVQVGLGHVVGAGERGHLAWHQLVLVDAEHDPVGVARLMQVGPPVSAPAGETGSSVTPTPVRVTFPVLETTKE